jgi:hypothetical protein
MGAARQPMNELRIFGGLSGNSMNWGHHSHPFCLRFSLRPDLSDIFLSARDNRSIGLLLATGGSLDFGSEYEQISPRKERSLTRRAYHRSGAGVDCQQAATLPVLRGRMSACGDPIRQARSR